MRQVPERFNNGHQEHLAIIAALRSQDAEGARAAVASHIDNVRDSIVRRLS
ncbi:FCD domain-containing protein [Candidatus Sodalis endolongispinus]|uniref:FCD domain-containing protein n=1 Tax=Candidatus Sodalis endolongispinus TaxID=2812662 RepID=UPI002484CCF0|nr:FCD domain-containing protein [Candidatus Sodalis endolongispinus]